MSPRKTRYRIPEWKVKQHKARGKKLLFGPYCCPKCEEEKLRIDINRKEASVKAICNCGFEHS